LRFSAFQDTNPKGFGLIQRERSFACYQDLECSYHRRPSVWIKPVGDWGAGAVRMVELPATSEFHDNVVVFWEPRKALGAGDSVEYAYDIVWYSDNDALPPRSRLVSMRSGAVLGPPQPRARKFVLEFAWPTPPAEGTLKPESLVVVMGGHLSAKSDEYNAINRTWRIAFDVYADGVDGTVEIRADLRKDGVPCTETWTYHWIP